MKKNILPLTKKLITLKTTPDYPEQLREALSLVLDELNDFTIEQFEKDGVVSALIYNTEKRPATFKLIFNGHLDVIPGTDSQYVPKVEGDRLYGVGAMDMKANLVTAMMAFKETAKTVSYPLALQIVTDEEVGGFDGTKYQIDAGVRSEFVLSVEPTKFNIVNQAKGVLWLKITAKGETAHGAYPWRGENAVVKIHLFLAKLLELIPIPSQQVWETTCNIASIQTLNTTFNKIPDECSVLLDIRFIPGEENILQKIHSIIPTECVVEVLANEPALNTDNQNQYINKLKSITTATLKRPTLLRSAQGSSDARHYSRVGGNGIEFGPVGEGIGSDNEWVSLSSLNQFYDILVNYIKALDK